MPAQKQITKPEEAGESSTSAAKKALTAASNGVPNYELPWSVIISFLQLSNPAANMRASGSKSIAQSSSTM